MSGFAAEWVNKGHYILHDQEYGHRVCSMQFAYEIVEAFSEERMQKLADDVLDIIARQLELETDDDPNLRPNK